MELELVITSYQRLSPSVVASRRFGPAGVCSIGRADSCDWPLPDPSRVVSSCHAEIRADGDQFLIRDTSTNGVFINQSSDPLGKGEEQVLNNGDRLRIGDYELSVTLHASANSGDSGSLAGGDAGEEASAAAGPGSSLPVQNRPLGSAASARPELKLNGTDRTELLAPGTLDTPLASGLNERFLADTHVDLPGPEIPDQWNWGSRGVPEAQGKPVQPGQLAALLEGLGLDPAQGDALSASQYLALGSLTRTLLERLLDLLHVRAQQKQELRVKQTLFRRSENNPLKFSATSRDVLESLLLRPHSSFLGPEESVNQAFDDLLSHEKALLSGVEQVIADLLAPDEGEVAGRRPFGRGRRLEAIRQQKARQREEYGDIRRVLRSDTFVDAYEQAVSRSERE
ncbi:type VI secretion system-associated FHA domain protein TagH [uncultured Marinobacter sp.]|uniref:type VI secretion system-associated FHA domain protein TagH n=1 Tax=uncultured Marinobacter sp. TaxID=187379 RepID=UPI0030DB3108